jgi:hypothetical protein
MKYKIICITIQYNARGNQPIKLIRIANNYTKNHKYLYTISY